MQSKVSMVMPCYNKVEYIGEMFDSIIAQEWDNIELILVNDGSTDGTREVISEYEPLFKRRGYDVVIIDQENAGVCAAGKVGLERVTGNYVCLVDSDDMLDPRYCSAMAGWLDEHSDYDYCVCSRAAYYGVKDDKTYCDFSLMNYHENDTKVIARYLMWDICRVVWIYMLRAEYLEKCRIVENYHTSTKFSHEPSYVIPILANSGKYKILPDKLYKFNVGRTAGHSDFTDYEYTRRFFSNYKLMCDDAIEKLADKSDMEKVALKNLINIETSIAIVERLDTFDIEEAEKDKHIQGFLDKVDDLLQEKGGSRSIVSMASIKPFLSEFIQAVRKTILGDNAKDPIRVHRRIIGYGALGKNAQKYLPLLADTEYQPTELWDINGDGLSVRKPDFQSLRSDDIVLILVTREAITEDVKRHAGTAAVLNVNDLITQIIISKYDLSRLHGQFGD